MELSAIPTTYTTSSTIFLPSALFNPLPVPQTFTGQVTTTGSTTYYTLTYELGLSFFNPNNVPHTDGGFYEAYVFYASAAGTQYSVPPSTTVSCAPTHGRGTAACTTLYPGVAPTSGFDGPSYWKVDNIESSAYLAYFTSTAPFPAATAAGAAPASTPAPLALGPRAKVGIALGVPLGVCACALSGVLLLLFRYRRRKRGLNVGRTGAVAGPDDVDGDVGDKMVVGSGDGDGGGGDVLELRGAEVRGYQSELEGSVAEGRGELA